MSDFGSREYSAGKYGGRASPLRNTAIPTTIEVYDNTLAFKGLYQSGVGEYLGCQFTLDESGPRDFMLMFSGAVSIGRKDIIKIRIFGSLDYFFTGVVREIPIDGSTKAEYNYTGFGLNDYLVRINAENRSYTTKTISYIIDDLLDNVVLSKNDVIQKNPSKIIVPNITISSLVINYAQVMDVFRTLKKIAASDGQNYRFGIDTQGDFFFKPRSLENVVTLVVGKEGIRGIDGYEPVDEIEQRTKFFVLDKDGNYVTTISSTEDNDIFEEKLTAPDIDNASIALWAQGILTESEVVTRSATINWAIEPWDPILLRGDGVVRIISNIAPESRSIPSPNPYGSGTYGSGLYGGGQYTGKDIIDNLRCVEVTYSVTGGQADRTIQLGALPVRVDDQINNIRKSLVDLEISLGV